MFSFSSLFNQFQGTITVRGLMEASLFSDIGGRINTPYCCMYKTLIYICFLGSYNRTRDVQ
jgi:hypothetical protein